MKRLLCVIACMLLCLLLFAACGKQGRVPDPGKTADTLWGKQVRLETVDVPAEALQYDSARVIAMAPDGKHLLCISYEAGPYLYNLETGAVTAVIPGDSASEQTLRQMLQLSAVVGRTQEEMTAFQDAHPELYTASGTRLMDLLVQLTQDMPRPTPYAAQTQGNYLVVASYSVGYCGAIDCDTGKLYVTPDRAICLGVMEDQLICASTPLPSVTLYNVKTGETRKVDFSFAMPDSSYVTIQSAAPLPDGSLCALVGGETVYEPGQTPHRPIALAVLRPDGTRETYDLEQDRGTGMYLIVPASDNAVLAVSLQARTAPLYLIRRDTGTVSLLWVETEKGSRVIRSAPVAECLNADGLPDTSDRTGGAILITVGRLSDGKTALLFDSDANCPILLFRPESMETAPLMSGVVDIPLLGLLTGNGYDLWFDQYADTTHYFRLTEAETSQP